MLHERLRWPVQKREHLLALAFFSLLTLALSWPLPLRAFAWVPGMPQWAFDESTFIWNAWYFKHALIDNLRNPLYSDLIYYPLGIDLILYTYNVFNALIVQPLHVAVGLVFASNVSIWFSTVLSGYGTFLLVRWLLVREGGGPYQLLPALLAGLVYAFASNRAIYMALGHYDMTTTQWIPFYALALLRSLDSTVSLAGRRKAALLAGVFFAFTGLAEMISAVFLAIFTIITIIVLGAITSAQCTRPSKPHTPWPLQATGSIGLWRIAFSSLSITAVVAFLLWSPVLIPILVQFFSDDFSLKGWGEAIPLSTDLMGWWTPTVLHPLFGGDLVAELRRVQLRALEGSVRGFRDLNTVFIGWGTAALALLGWLVFGRRVRIWAWTALTFGLFALGPFLQINGQYRFDLDGVQTSFPLPYTLLHYIPIVKANRAPNRNSILLMLGVAVLVAYGGYWILKASSSWLRRFDTQRAGLNPQNILCSIVLSAVILFEHLAIPLPLSDHRVPAVYAQIAAHPQPVSILHAPLGWRNSFGTFGAERTRLQYFQSVHQKPMLGGNISRAPDFKMDYFRRIPLFQAIREVEFSGTVAAELAAQATLQAGELMYLYNVGYVLLMPSISQRFPYADHWQATWDFYKRTLPLEAQPFWRGNGIEAYRVVQPAGSDSFQLALGTAGTFPYRGPGWDMSEVDAPYGTDAIWATANESCLFMPLRHVDSSQHYQFTAQVRPFTWPGGGNEWVRLQVNGIQQATLPLQDDWQILSWLLAGDDLLNSLNRVCFLWEETAAPRMVLAGERSIGSTGVHLPLDAELKSFVDGAFIALFDEETGAQIDASAGRRGVNVTVLDPRSGEVLEMQGFDTTANAYESRKLAAFLAQIPAGHPVLVANRGEAAAFLEETAVEGLRSLGAAVSLAELRGHYFVLVGVKGAKPGTALQAMDDPEVFLSLSLNRDRRSLAAAVGVVEIKSQAFSEPQHHPIPREETERIGVVVCRMPYRFLFC